MLGKAPKLSVIVPAYNEEESIGNVLEGLLKMDFLPMEIIVVDDCSEDGTAEVVKKFASVKYLNHNRNRGKGAALRTGIKSATGEIVLIQDADQEYPISNIPTLLELVLKGLADVVYGSRFRGNCIGMSFSHVVGNKILSLVTRILYGTSITDMMTGHKVFLRKVLDSFDLKEDGFTVEAEITSKSLKNGWRLVEVPITYNRRKYGVAKIGYWDGVKSLLKILAGIFTNYTRNESQGE